jgi:MFS family permease
MEKSRPIWKVLSLAIPTLMAITLAELVNAEIYLHGPVKEGTSMFIGWNILQTIPAFLFGYISDRNYRKQALIASQALGVVGGSILYFFGAQLWVLILIALLFNPMSVARAALLDNFPHYSTLKLVAVTFIAQYFPWLFFNQIQKIMFGQLILFTLIMLLLNLILTVILFKDKRELIHPKIRIDYSIDFIKNDKRIVYTLLAFVLSEITFYLTWVYIEYSHDNAVWLDLTTSGTIIGILIVMLYNKLPHMSIVTLLYSVGFGTSLVAILTCALSVFNCEISLLSAMSHYSVIGGMYLPFVTDAVIKMFGNRNKAMGAAMIEFGDAIAVLIAPTLYVLFNPIPSTILWMILILYIIATTMQKMAEKNRSLHLPER